MPTTKSRGRAGRPWRRARARRLAQGDPCAWCGNYIDLSIGFPHPLSPTVDHIIPLARGGDPLDSNNLQPMHKVCNERKAEELARTSALACSRRW